MCGIAGIRHYDDAPINTLQLMAMREAIRLRGPDGAGVWLEPRGGLGLAHRSAADYAEASGVRPTYGLSDAPPLLLHEGIQKDE